MNLYFAHADEIHDTATQSAWHAITDAWYLALGLYLLVLFSVGAAVYLVSKSKTATFSALLGILFIIGLLSFSVTPVVSIVSLAGGFMLAFTIVIAGLGGRKR